VLRRFSVPLQSIPRHRFEPKRSCPRQMVRKIKQSQTQPLK
jgi:hypothetical protein